MRGRLTGGWLGTVLLGALSLNLLQFCQPSRLRAHAGSTLPQEPPPVPEESNPTAAQRCAEPLRLVASVVNLARPRLSLAVVRSQGGARVLTLGGRVDDLVLVALKPEYAALRGADGALCILPVFEPSSRTASIAQPAVRRASATPSASTDEETKAKALLTREQIRKGLRALGDGSFSLSRELLLEALKNPGGAAAGAYFKLREKDGHTLGMEVRGVRDGSTLSQMGIRTGDLVRSMNGIDVSTPLGLLAALRTARESESITVSVVRDGRERALRYLVE